MGWVQVLQGSAEICPLEHQGCRSGLAGQGAADNSIWRVDIGQQKRMGLEKPEIIAFCCTCCLQAFLLWERGGRAQIQPQTPAISQVSPSLSRAPGFLILSTSSQVLMHISPGDAQLPHLTPAEDAAQSSSVVGGYTALRPLEVLGVGKKKKKGK